MTTALCIVWCLFVLWALVSIWLARYLERNETECIVMARLLCNRGNTADDWRRFKLVLVA